MILCPLLPLPDLQNLHVKSLRRLTLSCNPKMPKLMPSYTRICGTPLTMSVTSEFKKVNLNVENFRCLGVGYMMVLLASTATTLHLIQQAIYHYWICGHSL